MAELIIKKPLFFGIIQYLFRTKYIRSTIKNTKYNRDAKKVLDW
jgi:hypothetical protein